jgi:hypothetical protein
MYNNDEAVTGSSLRSLIKVLYYQAFALVYGLAGACAGEGQRSSCCAGMLWDLWDEVAAGGGSRQTQQQQQQVRVRGAAEGQERWHVSSSR